MDGLTPSVKLGIEIAKNAISSLPIGPQLLVARRRRRGPSSIGGNDPASSRRIFAYQEAMISRHRAVSGRLLEIGPGRSLGVAALFVKAGCSRAIAIDVEPWLDAADEAYEQLDVLDEVRKVTYMCPMPLDAAPFPDGYFDLIVSHVVAEYFRDPENAVARIVRMLAPGGVSLHQIRLLGHWTTRDPTDFLRPSDRAWRLATSNRPGQPNRWRLSDWTAAFERHGAAIIEAEVPSRVPVSAATRARLARQFRTKSLDDLSAYNARILATRPPE